MIDIGAKLLSAAIGGGFAALIFAAPASAEPAPLPIPAPAPAPIPAPESSPAPLPVPDTGPAPVAAPGAETVPAPGPDGALAQAAPQGVPHLASPDALPPGSTMDPGVMAGAESPNVSYLRDLWQAVQSREISGKEALLLGISQRNLNTPVPAHVPGTGGPASAAGPAPAVAPPAAADAPAPATP